MSSTEHGDHAAKSEREIEEDIMDVPVIAWLGTVSTILIIVAVILLTGLYHLTQRQQDATRQEEADTRITDLEAYRLIDATVVNGHFQQPDSEENGTVTRGKVNLPVEIGMSQIADKY